MKTAVIILATLLLNNVAFGQAQVHFTTRVLDEVEAPVWMCHSALPYYRPPGPGFTVQLYWDNGGSLVPLIPTTTFRTTPGREQYIEPVDITIVGLQPGSPATFLFRAWETAAGSYEQAIFAHWRGESAPVTVVTGGGLFPPANLVGLAGFIMGSLSCIPEPSTIALAVLGAAAQLFRHRKK